MNEILVVKFLCITCQCYCFVNVRAAVMTLVYFTADRCNTCLHKVSNIWCRSPSVVGFWFLMSFWLTHELQDLLLICSWLNLPNCDFYWHNLINLRDLAVLLYWHAVTETWRRVWGDRKNVRGPKFLNDVFSILTPKDSDDFFLVIDQVFLIFTLSFQILCIFTV